MTDKEKLMSTLKWGFLLWLLGWVAGVVLYMVVPEGMIGWVITPFATVVTVWVVYARIRRPELVCYLGLGMVWIIMAVVLDLVFNVWLFGIGASYYKWDIWLYYGLTLVLPIGVGYWKFMRRSAKAKLF